MKNITLWEFVYLEIKIFAQYFENLFHLHHVNSTVSRKNGKVWLIIHVKRTQPLKSYHVIRFLEVDDHCGGNL